MEMYSLDLPGADLFYITDFIPEEEAYVFFNELLWEIAWEQRDIQIYGKSVPQPRLTAYYGDDDYTYSGMTSTRNEWSPSLLMLREKVEEACGSKFNAALLNQYRSGRDSIGFHSDNEPELGSTPIIASVSLGEVRDLIFKAKEQQMEVPLLHGSLLIMAGDTQKNYKHGIMKTSESGVRINVTFRNIL